MTDNKIIAICGFSIGTSDEYDIKQNAEEDKVYETIVFMQDSNADEALKILEEEGEDAAVDYLSQWDDGDGGEETKEEPWGKGDTVYKTGDLVLSYNTGVGYIGLARVKEVELDWDKVNEDIQVIERQCLTWLDKQFGATREEGHDSENERVGTLFVYHNLEEIKEVIDNEEGLTTSSGSLYIDFEGLNYPGLIYVTIDFFALEMEDDDD